LLQKRHILCSFSAPSGLVILKPKLEDLGLKYTEPCNLQQIVSKKETKEEQDAHIVDISDVKKHHDIEECRIYIKGRPKSVYSIRRKMKSSKCKL
jgi:GTP pyrophosphokinase